MTRSSAAVAIERGVTDIVEFEIPTVKNQDAVLKMEIVGVCGTDWYYYQDESASSSFPLILGHECVGRVHQIGEGASTKWSVHQGDRVGVLEVIPCGVCQTCQLNLGNKFLCSNPKRYGTICTTVEPSLWGGFSEFMYVDPKSILFRIPEEIPRDVASLIVPISNGIDWARKGAPADGTMNTILVIGSGQHGLGCVVAAKNAGVSNIIVIGLSKDSKRLDVARSLGADHTIEADTKDVLSSVKDFTSGSLADAVINVTDGSPESFLTSLELARKGGTVVMSGYSHSVLNDFRSDMIIEKALTVKGVRGRELGSVNEALNLMMEKSFPLKLLCSHDFSLQETDSALRTFARLNAPDHAIHVSIVP